MGSTTAVCRSMSLSQWRAGTPGLRACRRVAVDSLGHQLTWEHTKFGTALFLIGRAIQTVIQKTAPRTLRTSIACCAATPQIRDSAMGMRSAPHSKQSSGW